MGTAGNLVRLRKASRRLSVTSAEMRKATPGSDGSRCCEGTRRAPWIYIKKAFDLAPDRDRAAANLGGAYVAAGRCKEAVPLLEKALTLEPYHQTYSNLGAALMYLGRYQEAADAMEHAVKLAPNNHDYWRNLADSYRRVPTLKGKADGAYRKALGYAQTALMIKPDDSDLLSSIGLYYSHLGEKREAITFTKGALKIAPNDPSVLFTAGLTSEIIGQRKNALDYLANAAKAGYPLTLIDKEPELAGLHSDLEYRKWIEQAWRSANLKH